ncbi:SpaH/EbpB family LPXTG-anchored major pilin [Actinobaculum sp. 313]|uniref:SpaH/EbpB family LPXTG-anchored major pilin n=1 Tax=Actinobaculum sp. 313 TaxID=2495645 RepID=UPI000D52A101|nr:SpaH/EbpB family LPXTG-anchored major pilin [Actinobaculum sp. 313]AWE41458.1 type 2 fimbrial subunit [Actinobaculum sp. 313]
MSAHTHLVGKRGSAVVGALALGMVGIVGGTSAVADELSYGNIDQNAKGSIIVHKHLNGDGTLGTPDGSGTEGDKPVEGVTFAAYPITSLDLSKASDWETLSNLTVPDNACANPTSPTLDSQTLDAAAGSATTISDGSATIGNLKVAAYLVCETDAPANIVQKAKPFVVTIPYPNTADGEEGNWLYNVNVYPKNEEISISKTVENQSDYGYGLGSVVSFPVTTTIPTLDETAYFKYFQIKDAMDERFGEVEVSSVTLGTTPLAEGTDYTVNANGNSLTVAFTKEGLIKLKNNASAELKVVFQGKITSVGDGNIKNKAQLLTDTEYSTTPPPDDPDDPEEPENPPTTPEVVTHWGDVKVRKVDADNTDKGLAGATFQVYAAEDPYASNCSSAVKTGSPLSVNGTDTFTSDSNGVVEIAGLYVSDSENDPKDATQRCYVLVETAAPAGFVVPSNNETPLTVKIGQTATGSWDATIANSKQTVPGLPLTGAQGKLLMTLGGIVLLLVAGGSVMVVRSRRQKAAEQSE